MIQDCRRWGVGGISFYTGLLRSDSGVKAIVFAALLLRFGVNFAGFSPIPMLLLAKFSRRHLPDFLGTRNLILSLELSAVCLTSAFRKRTVSPFKRSKTRTLELYPLLLQAGEIPGMFSLEHQLELLDVLSERMEQISNSHQQKIDSSIRLWNSLSVFNSCVRFLYSAYREGFSQ